MSGKRGIGHCGVKILLASYPPTGVSRLLQSAPTVGEMGCFPGEHQLHLMRLIDMLIVHDSKGCVKERDGKLASFSKSKLG